MKQTQMLKIRSYLAELGLEKDEISVFLYLNSHGRSSVLGISRGLDTGRTKLYTLLEQLLDKQIVVAHKRHYGTNYEAASLRSLEFLVAEIEAQAEKMKRSLPSVINTLTEMRHKSPLGSRTIEYRGIDGLNQMNFHLNQANGLIQVFELAQLGQHPGIDPNFAEKLREQRVASRYKI